MRRRVKPLHALLVSLSVATLAGCTQAPDVDFTIPANGATGVTSDAVVSVAFTSTLEAETVTDAGNLTVTVSGETDPHEVTITLDEEGRVITITPDNPYGTGKTVTVSLSERIRTSTNIPIDDYVFTFQTAGVSADPEFIDDPTGVFLLQSVRGLPEAGPALVDPSPILAAIAAPPQEFFTDTIVPENVTIRGSLTGLRDASVTAGAPTSLTSPGLNVRLANGSLPFEPGEKITVTFGNGFEAPGDEIGDPPRILRTHSATFEARSGTLTLPAGLTDAMPISLDIGEEVLTRPRQVLFADLLPTEAPELVVIEESGIVNVFASFGGQPYAFHAAVQVEPIVRAAAGEFGAEAARGLVLLHTDGSLELLRLSGDEFVSITPYTVAVSEGEPRDLALGDLDGDGRLEVLVAAGDRVEVVRDDPATEGFVVEEGPFLPGVLDIEVADFDLDGRLDLVSSEDSRLRILRGAGDRTFLEVATVARSVIPGALAVGPIDDDRYSDILIGEANALTILVNPGNGSLAGEWATAQIASPQKPARIATGDFDGDGTYDVIWYDDRTDPTATVRTFGATFAEWEEKTFALPPEAVEGGFALADTNRDGARDILFHGGSSPQEGIFLIAETRDVIATGGPEFALTLEPLPSAAEGTVRLALAGTIPEPVERLSFALALPAGFSLASGAYLEGDLFQTTAGLSDEATEDGVFIEAMFGDAPLTQAQAQPIGTLVLQYSGVSAGSHPVGILPSSIAQSGGIRVTTCELPDGRIIAPRLTGAIAEVEVTDDADPVPAVLSVQCVVDSNGVKVINWELPPDPTITAVRISSGAQVLATLPPGSIVYEDTGSNPRLTYTVRLERNGILSEAVRCTLPLTEVTCVRGTLFNATLQRIDLGWTSPGSYDSITIRRDGVLVSSSIPGTTTSAGTNIDPTADCGRHVYEIIGVVGGQPSVAAFCVLEPAAGCSTILPVTQLATSEANERVTLFWTNGEAYDSVEIRRDNGSAIETTTLLGSNDPTGFVTATSFSDEGVVPGSYTYEVVAFAGALSGSSGLVDVDLDLAPPLFTTCELGPGGVSNLAWSIPEGVTYDTLTLERTDDQGGTTSLGSVLGLTEFTDTTLVPGVVTYKLVAGLTTPAVSAESLSCPISRVDAFDLDPVTTILGRSGSIPITGTTAAPADGFSFRFTFDPTALEIFAVRVGDTVLAPGTTIDPDNGLASIDVAADLALPAGPVTYAEIEFRTALVNSETADGSLLTVEDGAVIRNAGGGSNPVSVSRSLAVRPRGIFIDPVVTTTGGFVEGFIYGSSNLDLASYSLALAYDRTLLSLEVLSTVGTVGAVDFDAPEVTIDPLGGQAALSITSGIETIAAGARRPLAFFRFQVSPDAEASVTAIQLRPWSDGQTTYANTFANPIGVNGVTPTILGGRVTIETPTSAAASAAAASTVSGREGSVASSFDRAGTRRTARAGLSRTPRRSASPRLTVARTAWARDLETSSFETASVRGESARSPSSERRAQDSAGASQGAPLVLGTRQGVLDLTDPSERSDLPVLGITSIRPTTVDACAPGRVLLEGSRFPTDLEVYFGETPATVVRVSSSGHGAVVEAPAVEALAAADRRAAWLAVTVIDPSTGTRATLADAFRHGAEFLRGDIDQNGVVETTDLYTLRNVFAGVAQRPAREDVADVNDDGVIGIADLIFLSAYLHGRGPAPHAPFPVAGEDPTADALPGCAEVGDPVEQR